MFSWRSRSSSRKVDGFIHFDDADRKKFEIARNAHISTKCPVALDLYLTNCKRWADLCGLFSFEKAFTFISDFNTSFMGPPISPGNPYRLIYNILEQTSNCDRKYYILSYLDERNIGISKPLKLSYASLLKTVRILLEKFEKLDFHPISGLLHELHGYLKARIVSISLYSDMASAANNSEIDWKGFTSRTKSIVYFLINESGLDGIDETDLSDIPNCSDLNKSHIGLSSTIDFLPISQVIRNNYEERYAAAEYSNCNSPLEDYKNEFVYAYVFEKDPISAKCLSANESYHNASQSSLASQKFFNNSSQPSSSNFQPSSIDSSDDSVFSALDHDKSISTFQSSYSDIMISSGTVDENIGANLIKALLSEHTDNTIFTSSEKIFENRLGPKRSLECNISTENTAKSDAPQSFMSHSEKTCIDLLEEARKLTMENCASSSLSSSFDDSDSIEEKNNLKLVSTKLAAYAREKNQFDEPTQPTFDLTEFKWFQAELINMLKENSFQYRDFNTKQYWLYKLSESIKESANPEICMDVSSFMSLARLIGIENKPFCSQDRAMLMENLLNWSEMNETKIQCCENDKAQIKKRATTSNNGNRQRTYYLQSMRKLFIHELHTIILLFEAQFHLSSGNIYRCIAYMNKATNQLDFLSKELEATEAPKRKLERIVDPKPRNNLILWFMHLYNLLMAKFCLYASDTLAPYCPNDFAFTCFLDYDNGYNFVDECLNFCMESQPYFLCICTGTNDKDVDVNCNIVAKCRKYLQEMIIRQREEESKFRLNITMPICEELFNEYDLWYLDDLNENEAKDKIRKLQIPEREKKFLLSVAHIGFTKPRVIAQPEPPSNNELLKNEELLILFKIPSKHNPVNVSHAGYLTDTSYNEEFAKYLTNIFVRNYLHPQTVRYNKATHVERRHYKLCRYDQEFNYTCFGESIERNIYMTVIYRGNARRSERKTFLFFSSILPLIRCSNSLKILSQAASANDLQCDIEIAKRNKNRTTSFHQQAKNEESQE